MEYSDGSIIIFNLVLMLIIALGFMVAFLDRPKTEIDIDELIRQTYRDIRGETIDDE